MHFKIFSQFAGLQYGISEKRDGNMKIGIEEPVAQKILKNRTVFFESRGIDPDKVISARLAHSNKVRRVFAGDRGKIIPEMDGLATAEPNVFVSITIADCVPVYFFDPVKQVVCLTHAGLKGILSGIVKNSVKLLNDEFRTQTDNLLVGLGPSIKKRNYDISNYNEALFKGFEDFIEFDQSRKLIDLQGIIRAQLSVLGVKIDNIEVDPDCTFDEKEAYFSYRRDRSDPLETMVAYIGIKS